MFIKKFCTCATTKSPSVFKLLKTQHNEFIEKYTKWYVSFALGIAGFFSGTTHYLVHCGKGSWNEFLKTTRTAIDNELNENYDTEQKINIDNALKQFKFNRHSIFNIIIIPGAPFAVNMFTTGLFGAVVGYGAGRYWPIALPVILTYNYLNGSLDKE